MDKKDYETMQRCEEYYAIEMEHQHAWSGMFDKDAEMIMVGDKVSGLFYHGQQVIGVCAFKNAAFGIKWDRSGTEEFTPFCTCWNVEWEVVEHVR